ncbi:Ig-like domain-containing protein [Brevibacillus borstelensis]|uniref:Ig-like domain-containing protein n=1 Tax=Brevibacillus borstelensis TaxID=45462 RepID=UPI002E1E9D64|nr:Ig-like domain-containing protein [Brevibacillus borstelensis]
MGLTINGDQAVTVDALVAAGYKVEFQATSDVFKGNAYTSETGELKDGLSVGTTFKYKVVVTKDTAKFESDLLTVKVSDDTVVVEPTEAKLKVGSKLWDLGYVTTDDAPEVVITKGKNFAGTVIDKNTGDDEVNGESVAAGSVTYTSSNPAVALVSSEGKIKVLKAGTTTITVAIGDKSTAIELVVKDSPVATKVQETSAKVLKDETSLELTLLDQYDAKLRKAADITGWTVSTGSDKADVIDLANAKLAVDNSTFALKVTDLAFKAGTDTLVIKNKDNAVVGTVSVQVVDVAGQEPDNYKLVPASSTEDLKLDIYPTKETVDLSIEKYVGDVKVGTVVEAEEGFTFVSDNEKVATVNAKGEVTAVAAGKAVISYKQGGITVATVEVEVTNSTPQITDIKLKEGKTQVEVAGGVETADAATFTDLIDELQFIGADGKEIALSVNNSDELTGIEFKTIVDSDDLVAVSDLGTVAKAATKAVTKDTKATLVITLDAAYGGKEVVLPILVTAAVEGGTDTGAGA